MKRELKRQQTWQLLLDTTQELIREKGCAKTTFSDIMERSGLSKGAIFHYVKSKDELLAMILQQKLEETNSRFFEGVIHEDGEVRFAGPMSAIANSLPVLEESRDITNQIFMYLLGRSDESAVEEIRRFYEQAAQFSRKWIETGQEHGVIPQSVNADKTADLFMLISFGLRVRGFIASDKKAFQIGDFTKLMVDILQPEKKSGR
ncbi:TetR/AcrR family transcriptional regulator [Paenibacillus doosanensis]|uniref:TetR/AcrR family transcriptional regulator n=1 Tax=Paenibacillus doosanensis TaxID=1229154 RepID=UPI00217F86F4|nr:TetR/AcrR family transcriptional regulator [Paenibacillus doosanensis]MCS7464325.1 TetR/AcrR family transcriptional regulator [Paenibacillus doosanensis]